MGRQMPPSNLIFNMAGDDNKYHEGERSKVGGREWGWGGVAVLSGEVREGLSDI